MTKDQNLQLDIALNRNQLHQIGRVAALSSFMDSLLDETISILLSKPPPTGRIITTRIRSIDTKCDIISELIKSVPNFPDAEETWRKVCKSIKDANISRNDIMHGLWHRDEDGKYYVVRYAKKNKRQHGAAIKMDATDIKKIASTMFEASFTLYEWLQPYREGFAMIEALRSSLDKRD